MPPVIAADCQAPNSADVDQAAYELSYTVLCQTSSSGLRVASARTLSAPKDQREAITRDVYRPQGALAMVHRSGAEQDAANGASVRALREADEWILPATHSAAMAIPVDSEMRHAAARADFLARGYHAALEQDLANEQLKEMSAFVVQPGDRQFVADLAKGEATSLITAEARFALDHGDAGVWVFLQFGGLTSAMERDLLALKTPSNVALVSGLIEWSERRSAVAAAQSKLDGLTGAAREEQARAVAKAWAELATSTATSKDRMGAARAPISVLKKSWQTRLEAVPQDSPLATWLRPVLEQHVMELYRLDNVYYAAESRWELLRQQNEAQSHA